MVCGVATSTASASPEEASRPPQELTRLCPPPTHQHTAPLLGGALLQRTDRGHALNCAGTDANLPADLGSDQPFAPARASPAFTRGVPQHVRMCLEAEPSLDTSALDHAGEAGRRERRATLRHEHEWRLGLLLTLQPAQSAAAHRPGSGECSASHVWRVAPRAWRPQSRSDPIAGPPARWRAGRGDRLPGSRWRRDARIGKPILARPCIPSMSQAGDLVSSVLSGEGRERQASQGRKAGR